MRPCTAYGIPLQLQEGRCCACAVQHIWVFHACLLMARSCCIIVKHTTRSEPGPGLSRVSACSRRDGRSSKAIGARKGATILAQQVLQGMAWQQS